MRMMTLPRVHRRSARPAHRMGQLIVLCAVGALLASCTSSGSPSSVPSGWIAHTISIGGATITVRTPPSWDHVLTPAQNGGINSDGRTYVANFPLHPFCWKRTDAYGCTPRNLGHMSTGSAVLTLQQGSPSWPPHPTGLGGWPVDAGTLDGFPAIVDHFGTHDLGCATWGGRSSIQYDVNLWVPSAAEIYICVAGPALSKQLALAEQVAHTATFVDDPATAAPPANVDSLGAHVSGPQFGGRSPLSHCSSTDERHAVEASATQGTTSITFKVESIIRSSGPSPCSVPTPCVETPWSTAFAVRSPAGQVIFLWQPIEPLRACVAGLISLPLTISVAWTVPSILVRSGTYRVENVNIYNGSPHGAPFASTNLRVP